MKTNAPPPRARERPVNLEMLREYLEGKGYRGKNNPPELCVAAVSEFSPNARPYPCGKAEHRGQEISFRSGHFHRIATISADETESFRAPVRTDWIWTMVTVLKDGKRVAIAWGFVDELPLEFTVSNSFKIRCLRFVDRCYRRWRNKSWRSIFRGETRFRNRARP